MKIRSAIKILVLSILAFAVAISFTSCGCSDKDAKDGPNQSQYQSTMPTMTNADGKTPDELNSDEQNFLGTWKATSYYAENLYGHLIITINEDGTFDADVTSEKFSGTWKKTSYGLAYTSELMEGDIYFGPKCRLVIEDMGLHVTITKVD